MLFLKLEKIVSSHCLSNNMFYLLQRFSFFVGCVLSVVCKKSLPNQRSQRFPLFFFFFFSSLMLLVFMFRSVIHSELIFVCGVEFMFFNMDIQLFQRCFFKRWSFLHWIIFVPLSKIDWLYPYGSVSDLFCYTDPLLSWLHNTVSFKQILSFIYYLHFWLHWVFIAAPAFSLCSERWLLSWGAGASHEVASRCRTQLEGPRAKLPHSLRTAVSGYCVFKSFETR